jgi:transcriptional regulator GlxA family with amidase domain
VAILVFEGVEIIDFAGPYEVFGQAGYEVFTVGEKRAQLTTAMGQSITPAHSFADCPKADVLVIPGGNIDGALANDGLRDWIIARSGSTGQVLSVCNGAFILARTGLLDGKTSTTFFRLIEKLKTQAPKVKVVNDQRFVDNGKFISTAGLSSGIDGALHVIERIKGKGEAQNTALNLEYDWRPGSGFARAALADQEIPPVNVPALHDPKILRTEGDRSSWRVDAEFDTQEDLAELDSALRSAFSAKGWTFESESAGASQWHFKGREGAPWKASLALESAGAGKVVLHLSLQKAS